MSDEQIKRGIYNCPNCGAAATPESVRCAFCHSGLATLVCSCCFGAIFIGMKHCPWCGAAAVTGKPVEESTGKCPRCDETLLLVRVGAETVSECPKCGGLWVDNEAFDRICSRSEEQERILALDAASEAAGEKPSGQSRRMYIPCPICGKLMNRHQFAGGSGVIIDSCKAHGAWMDRSELKHIVEFIRDGGLARAREKEKDRLEQERLHLQEEKRHLMKLARLGNEPGSLDW